MGKIPIGGEKHINTMGKANGCYARVMHFRPDEFGPAGEPGKMSKMGRSLGEKQKRLALKPVFQKCQCHVDGSRRAVDARMGNNTDELMEAGPRNGPWRGVIAKSRETLYGSPVKRGVLPVGIDKNIGINGNHAVQAFGS